MKKAVCALLLLCLLASCTPTDPSGSPNVTPPPENISEAPAPSEEPWEIIDLGAYSPAEDIHVDQLGYRPGDPKKAVIPESADAFKIVRISDGAVMFSGSASAPMASLGSLETVRVADFTGLDQPGEYYLCAGKGRSYPFLIDENPYGDLRMATLDFFHYQKCGVDLEAGAWSHPSCHDALAFVLDTEGEKTGEEKDVSGGWHDAGDYSRYVVPAAQTVAQLLLAYELSPNPDPEVLDAVWFKIEWMLKMQDEATGGVYHKTGCKSFNALDQMPQNEKGELVITPISATATADFAASMALASRFYPEHKETLLDAARFAWQWCLDNPDAPGFRNPRGVSTGEYGDNNSEDERFWAACELFAATGEESFHDFIKSGELHTGLGWTKMGTYGLTAYLLHAGDKADDGLALRMRNKLQASCNDIMGRYQTEPYGVSLGSGYYWGSNMAVGNNAMTLLLGDLLLDSAPGYAEAALDQMHYLLGTNALSKSYISGFGSKPMQNPHHRPSVAIGQAVPGMVSGGPNGDPGDPTLKEFCKEGLPPMMCYIDHIDSYSSNEVAIYWNSPVYFVLAVLDL